MNFFTDPHNLIKQTEFNLIVTSQIMFTLCGLFWLGHVRVRAHLHFSQLDFQ